MAVRAVAQAPHRGEHLAVLRRLVHRSVIGGDFAVVALVTIIAWIGPGPRPELPDDPKPLCGHSAANLGRHEAFAESTHSYNVRHYRLDFTLPMTHAGYECHEQVSLMSEVPVLDTFSLDFDALNVVEISGNGDGVPNHLDVDSDGVQDPDEAGLGGVTVNLYTDPDGDGLYDTLAATTVTADDGSYIFDGLAPDSYVVEVVPPAGYTQTGDPDGALDNQTTSPIVLGPGDVVLTADFGYAPPEAQDNSVGDTIYLDANGNGSLDAGEAGIPGVTVALIQDTNGDGATVRTIGGTGTAGTGETDPLNADTDGGGGGTLTVAAGGGIDTGANRLDITADDASILAMLTGNTITFTDSDGTGLDIGSTLTAGNLAEREMDMWGCILLAEQEMAE